ncbi:hypothetical protein ADK60_27570, partial [Streptomyces sp. XY431]
ARLGELEEKAGAEIVFNYLGRFTGDNTEAEWSPTPELLEGAVDPQMPMGHALTINAMTEDRADGPHLVVSVSWPGALFAEAEVRELLDGWSTVLRAL